VHKIKANLIDHTSTVCSSLRRDAGGVVIVWMILERWIRNVSLSVSPYYSAIVKPNIIAQGTYISIHKLL
jgi:hypothetical protein